MHKQHKQGVPAGEGTDAAAAAVADVCAAVQWAGFTRARETAAQLKNLGLHLPELLGDAGADTATGACGFWAGGRG